MTRKVIVSDPPYQATDLPWDIAPLEKIRELSEGVDALILCCNHKLLSDLIKLGMRQPFHDLIIWNKSPTRSWVSYRKPLRSCELVSFWGTANNFDFRKSLEPQPPYAANRKGKKIHFHERERKPSTCSYKMWEQIWDIPVVPYKEKIHPTQKPLDLMTRLVTIATLGQPDTLIIDPFEGSGTTRKACEALGIPYEGSDSGDWQKEFSK